MTARVSGDAKPFRVRLESGETIEIRRTLRATIAQDRAIFDSYDFAEAPQYDLPRDLRRHARFALAQPGIVEGFRWSVTGVGEFPLRLIIISAIVIVGLTAGGLRYFNRMEETFADII